MSIIRKISLTQFRNYQEKTFEFPESIVYISGLNGVGKTNLLDAVYYLCYTKSYFTAYQQQLVQHGHDGFRIEGVFEENGSRQNVVCKWKSGKKELFENDVPVEKITDYVGKYSAVMIAPDDIRLINEGSEIRRKWTDSILAQTDRLYFEALIRYQQTLQQRNAWLKAHALKPSGDFTVLEFYDTLLVQYGTYLFEQRNLFMASFLTVLKSYYQQLSAGREHVELHYRSDLQQVPFQQLLKNSLYNDLQMQRTLKGIHRDEVDFVLNGRLIRQYGSQGQKKSYLFALKLAQFNYIRTCLQRTPILLLDDIFEKLDSKRLASLQEIISTPDYNQVLVTDTESRGFLKENKLTKTIQL